MTIVFFLRKCQYHVTYVDALICDHSILSLQCHNKAFYVRGCVTWPVQIRWQCPFCRHLFIISYVTSCFLHFSPCTQPSVISYFIAFFVFFLVFSSVLFWPPVCSFPLVALLGSCETGNWHYCLSDKMLSCLLHSRGRKLEFLTGSPGVVNACCQFFLFTTQYGTCALFYVMNEPSLESAPSLAGS